MNATSQPIACDLTITAATGREFVASLRKQMPRAIAILRPRLKEFSIALVGDKRMSQLHLQFMDIPGPTDVLTFPLELDSRGRAISGEVVICIPHARRVARQVKTSVADEVLLYALHGLLHLCGFDDRTDRDYRRMHRMEDNILSRLDVGAIFTPASHKPKRGRANQ